MSTRYHNYFGLKAGNSSKKGAWGVWDGTVANLKTREEYTPGTLTTIKDYFRVYKSVDEGVHGYFEFLNYSRYQNLKGVSSPSEFLNRIVKDGYCTSSTYVTTNMGIIAKYGLTKYDWDKSDASELKSIDDIAKEVIAGQWDTGAVRQAKLMAAGYDYKTVQKRVNEMLDEMK